MILELADAQVRDAARTSLTRSVIVEAGAGTGKTTLLIDRIVFLLLGGSKDGRDLTTSGGGTSSLKGSVVQPLDIARLVALTFTDKAASEIKFRLAERLNQISALAQGTVGEGVGSWEAAQRCWEELSERFERKNEEILVLAQTALRDIERAQIGTIHSFCAHILRLYPLEAGVDPEFRVDAGERTLDEMLEEEWALWLDRELGPNPPNAELWREVLAAAQLGELRELARGLISPRVDLAAAESSPATAPGSRAEPEGATANREMRLAVAPRLRELAWRVDALAEGQPKPRGRILDYLPWMSARFQAAAQAVECGSVSWTAPPKLASPAWPSNWDPARKSEYDRLCAMARRLDPRMERIYASVVRLLGPFVESFRAAYRRRGWITFDGLIVGARDLVRDDQRVRTELKHRFQALLIDEFQDTDPLQGEILMFLAEAPRGRAHRWEDVEPEQGKLFIVGDPKQSIYRFRGADIVALESFNGLLKRHGALCCSLQTNFRSHAGIVSAVNGIFDAVMRPSPGLQPAYIPIYAGREAEGAGVEWLQIAASESEPGRRIGAEESRLAEAEWIARWIREQRAPHRLRDIAIVLRSTSALGSYLEALKRAEIPYVVEGEKYFYATQEAADFLNVLRVVDDPADRVALVGLLRSPLIALEDREIYRLAQDDSLDYLKETARGDLKRLYVTLRGLHEQAGRIPLGDIVGKILGETCLIELASAAYHRQQTASNLLKFGRLAAEASDRGSTLKEFIEYVSGSIKELREEGESPLADEDYDAVRILTIHKAKGLEYPVVFLPNVSGRIQGGASADSVRVSWSSGTVGLRLKSASSGNAAMVLLEDEEELRQREEEVRVLYVAMTRPKDRLFLLGSSARGGASFASLLDAAGSLPSRLLAPDASRPRRGQAHPFVRPALDLDPKRRAALWKARARREKDAREKAVFIRPSAQAAAGALWARRAGSHDDGSDQNWLGRLCHAVLERWDFGRGHAIASAGDLKSLVAKSSAWLAREEPSAGWEKIRQDCLDILSRFLSSPAARELAEAEILGREVPFLYPDGDAAVRGTIDVLYRRAGKVFVADYKTDVLDSGSALEPISKAAKVKRAWAQGKFYVEAVERALGLRGVEFKVIFLREP